jgi:hypothetical protein
MQKINRIVPDEFECEDCLETKDKTQYIRLESKQDGMMKLVCRDCLKKSTYDFLPHN